MRDLYNFYQNSHRRKEELANEAIERTHGEKAISELNTEMNKSIEKGISNLRFFTHVLFMKRNAVQNTLFTIEEMECNKMAGKRFMCNSIVQCLCLYSGSSSEISNRYELEERDKGDGRKSVQ